MDCGDLFVTLHFKQKIMAEFEVTGLTYHIGAGLSKEDAKAAVKEFFKDLKIGTPLILQAEPSNLHDANAIAVYLNYTRHIGYIKSTSCLEVKPLLDENEQCDAVVIGNDGSKTMFIEIPNVPETVAISCKRERVLPQVPLGEVLKMDFTEEEKALQVVATRLLKLKPTVENVKAQIELSRLYLPLSELSICYEDCLWRDHILKNLRTACRLEVGPELKQQLNELYERLKTVEADQTRTSDRPKLKLMETQLDKLKKLSEAEDGLFANFEYHIASSGNSVKDELTKLEMWFKSMPHLKMRNYQQHDALSECLSYQHVSRKELYEVYAAILLLNRYARESNTDIPDFTDIKEYVSRVKHMLAADWTEEKYENLWDCVLSMPTVKTKAKQIGKQQNTTFNRNLIAHILRVMLNKGVFAVETSNQSMAEALEGTKDHSVRTAIGETLEDKAMKGSIEKLIVEKK